MVQYSHLFKSFLEFLMVHAVKGFGVVNETLVDVFLEFPSFRYDPVMLTTCGSLIALHFLNPLDIWNFLICIMLKPSMQDFKHGLTSMGDKCNCLMISTLFHTILFGNWGKN